MATKLYIPSPHPNLVKRQRLTKRLDEGLRLGHKLILIAAPAGFGKTTLASEWVQDLVGKDPSIATAWLSLDESDNDVVRFLTYLIAALQTIDGDIGQAVSVALRSPGTINVEAILISLINEVAGYLNNPSMPDSRHSRSGQALVLALNDYHVIESQSVDKALTFLIDHLPPRIHLVIATRTDPALGLSRLRARGQLTELRVGDLRFSTDEAVVFLEGAVHLPISAEHMRALEDRTEGWITGLQLAAVAMQGLRQQEQIKSFVHNFGGSHRYVIDYLLDEIFERQTPQIRTFLLQTSILERMVAPLCDAVRFGIAETPNGCRTTAGCSATASSDRTDSQSILEWLEAANLFLIPLDGERRWYRYHHLFADLLRQRLRQTQTEQIPNLHCRASEWYAHHGFQAEAVHHALTGGDTECAADLIEATGLSLIGQGAFASVRNWIDLLPDNIVRKRPYLCVYHAWTSNFAHQLDAIEPYLRDAECALQALEVSSQDTVARDLCSHIATLRAWNARRQHDNALAIEFLTEAADWLGDSSPFVRAFANLNLGLAYLDGGELVKAAHAFREAMSQQSAPENELASIMAATHLAAVLILQGRLHEAAKLCRKTIRKQVERYGKPPPTLCLTYLRLGWVLAEWNDVHGYFDSLSQGIILANQIGFDSVVTSGAISLVWEKQVLAEQGIDIEFSEDVVPIIERAMTVETDDNETHHASEDDADLSTIESQNLEVYLADDSYFEVWPGYSGIAQARKLAEENKAEEALALLGQIIESAQEVEGIGLMIEARVSEASIHQSRNDLDRALEALQYALSMSEPEGYIRTYADRDKTMAQLLRQAVVRGIMPDYTTKLLAAFGLQQSKNAIPLPSQPLVEPLSERELQVLQLIAQGLSNREISERLFVALSTIKGHNQNIYGKLQVQRRTEAIVRALELGLL